MCVVSSYAPGVINHHPDIAALQSWPSAAEKAGCVQSGKEAPLVQRGVAACAAGGIGSVPLHPYCAAALSNRTKAGCVQSGEESYGRPDTGPA